MSVNFLPGQVDCTSSTIPLPYTSSPLRLLWSDIKLFFHYAYALPGIIIPLGPWGSGALDELYPSPANIFDISLHLVLVAIHLLVLISIPVCLFVPVPLGAFVLYITLFLSVNYLVCLSLNGTKSTLESEVELGPRSVLNQHNDERWIFLNGVAVGQHWLQSNIDRLSLTFGRKVVGVHNPTKGIILDVIECLVQRDFSYNTSAIRQCYIEVKQALMEKKLKKVIFLLHSQGGIEGGLVLDWLLADVPNDLLQRLEVYTFGCAANHFNNPLRSRVDGQHLLDCLMTGRHEQNERVIRHIEHYANSDDFVSKWGVLNFAVSESYKDNRFVGRLFKREASGHMLNQHYLDEMFPLETPRGPVLEENDFMNMLVHAEEETAANRESATIDTLDEKDSDQPNGVVKYLTNTVKTAVASTEYLSATKANVARVQQKPVSALSRLWQYRNGATPED
ncbi:MAG: hypothetical protein M1833_001895 [Piccolia ochrophora]|nr:MAG: hypothetical protein M1833_001895 [Piccolia ochrophora]